MRILYIIVWLMLFCTPCLKYDLLCISWTLTKRCSACVSRISQMTTFKKATDNQRCALSLRLCISIFFMFTLWTCTSTRPAHWSQPVIVRFFRYFHFEVFCQRWTKCLFVSWCFCSRVWVGAKLFSCNVFASILVSYLRRTLCSICTFVRNDYCFDSWLCLTIYHLKFNFISTIFLCRLSLLTYFKATYNRFHEDAYQRNRRAIVSL